MSEQKSYLSIDLDYWMLEEDDKESSKFFNKVFELNLPIFVVRDHQDLLPKINSSGCNYVYNVDYHSDIYGFYDKKEADEWMVDNPVPECGTWSSFVDWKSSGTFHWIYPDHRCYTQHNSDDESGVCWVSKEDNPYLKGVYGQWKQILKNRDLKRIKWETINAIGICVSPEWYSFLSVDKIMDILGVRRDRDDNIKKAGFFANRKRISELMARKRT